MKGKLSLKGSIIALSAAMGVALILCILFFAFDMMAFMSFVVISILPTLQSLQLKMGSLVL